MARAYVSWTAPVKANTPVVWSETVAFSIAKEFHFKSEAWYLQLQLLVNK